VQRTVLTGKPTARIMFMSLRFKLLLIVMAGMALLGFIITLQTAKAIDNVQDQLASQMEELSRRQLMQLQGLIQADLNELIAPPDFHGPEGRQLLMRRGKQIIQPQDDYLQIFLTDLNTTSNTIIIQNNQGNVEWHQTSTANFDQTIRQMAFPLLWKGRQVAEMSFLLNTDKVAQRQQAASREMQRSLRALIIVSFIIMLIIFFLLWKTFKRHMETTVRATRLKQMAYVGTLASGLAHEIRNPLHAMGINLAVVKEEIDDPRDESPEKISKIVTRLSREVDELNATVTNFLEYARPESQAPGPCDFAELLRNVCFGVQRSLEEIGGRLVWEIRIPPAPGETIPRAMIKAQKAALSQAMQNIVTNAVQVMAELRAESPEKIPEPKLTVLVEREGDLVQATISDNGPGIDQSELKKIFEVFYSKRAGGSGFGLAITRRVIAEHGGRIVVKSRHGQGATFVIKLPVLKDSASPNLTT
jgi:signal transduction histidine kinase